MQVCEGVSVIWLILCGLLSACLPADTTDHGPWIPDWYHEDGTNNHIPTYPSTSCQVENGSDLYGNFPSFTDDKLALQLNICRTHRQTQMFLFNMTMFKRWHACLCFGNSTACEVRASEEVVVSVEQHCSNDHGMGSSFLCLQPDSGTMRCERSGSVFPYYDIGIYGLYQCPGISLTWNSSQTTVSARCSPFTAYYIFVNSRGILCSEAEGQHVTDQVNSSSNSTTIAATDHDSAHLPRNAVIGIVVACVLILVILTTIITLYLIKRRRKSQPASPRSSTQSTHSRAHNLPKDYLKKSNKGHGNSSNGYTNPSTASWDVIPNNTASTASWGVRPNNTASTASWGVRPNNTASTVDDHTYASIDVGLALSSEYMALDESTNYNHPYKTFVINDPKLRPPMPLPLHVTNQPILYYSAAEANQVISSAETIETVSGQYIELTEGSDITNLSITGGDYLTPLSLSPYRTEAIRQPNPYVSLASSHGTPQLNHSRNRTAY